MPTTDNKTENNNPHFVQNRDEEVKIADTEWKQILPEEVYHVARQKGTERPFTGKYWNSNDVGTYYCIACGNKLFTSDGKFNSNCGWPSFFEPVTEKSIKFEEDNTYNMKRTEVLCGKCDAHLGHVFEDGPPPTGLRYCINSVSLKFDDKKEK